MQDVDRYTVDLLAGQTVDIVVTSEPGESVFDAWFRDPNGTYLATERSVESWTWTWTADVDGPVELELMSVLDLGERIFGTRYEIEVTVR